MTGTFLLRVRESFAAAHIVRGHPGKCGRLHGHNWHVEAEIKTKQLGDLGMGMDFYDIRKAMQELLNIVDHQHLNEIPPFDKINPTAENVAMWFYQQLSSQINSDKQKVEAISLWETDRCSVRYSQDD